MKNNHTRQRGSIIVYILVAIFLTGVLIAAMTQGAKTSADQQRIDEMLLFMQADIQNIQLNIAECAQTYSKAVDGVTNPNPPFPLYSDLSSGGAGVALADIKCPGAPASQQVIFTDGIKRSFKLLGDTSRYTTTYISSTTEGVLLRITRAVTDPLWIEAITRLNDKYSKCAAAAVTANPDPLTVNCGAGCFYYWILRQPTSSASFEAGCP